MAAGLSRMEISTYRDNGYLLVEEAVSADQLAALKDAQQRLTEASRHVGDSDDRFDLADGHSPDDPRLNRIKLPHKQDPVFWEVLLNSRLTAVLEDLLGENVALQTSKLNNKGKAGGAAIEWHQDWAFYPHTNDDLLAIGLMLDDVDEENGPLQVIPGSHREPLLSHFNDEGFFSGSIDPGDPALQSEKAITLTGKAGSATVHHVRMIHGSAPNKSERDRAILFYECLAADAWPLVGGNNYILTLGPRAIWADLQERMIIGQPVLEPRFVSNPVRVPLPPPAKDGSIFKIQSSGRSKSAF